MIGSPLVMSARHGSDMMLHLSIEGSLHQTGIRALSGDESMDEKALRHLLARQEITEAIHNYCRAMDRIDDDLGRSVFHADAVADYGAMFQGTGHGFIEFVHGAHSGLLVHTHQVSNISIRVDGDRAGSETYVTATLRMKTSDGALAETRSLGRYIDQWERRDGRWAISHRHYVHEMDDTRLVENARYATDGRRNRSDPSYGSLGTVEREGSA